MEKQDLHMMYIEENYEKLAKLSDNQNKITWLVRNKITNRIYVCKEVEKDSAIIYQKIQHIVNSHLININDITINQNKGIVIEEYVSGKTLEELLAEEKVTTEKAFGYVRQLLELLIVLEDSGIVHRDITPKNILISTDGILKLLDFGIAREQKQQQSQDTEILGTVGYAAPEQYGFCQTDIRSDIYSVGVLFHRLLTGELPVGNKCQSKIHTGFIQKCICMDPNARYQTAKSAYASLVSDNGSKVKTQVSVNSVKYDRSKMPGFRSGQTWKKIVAIIGYFMWAVYCIASVSECSSTPLSFILELIAVLTYIVLEFILITNCFNWYYRIPKYREWTPAVKMTIRVMLCIFVFYYGYLLETFVRQTLLHIQ